MGTANYKWYSTWKPATMVPIGIMTSQPPPPFQESPRTLHAFLYNWSRSLITTWRWPTYRAETCRCYNILLVIIDTNIFVFNCKHNTPSSLLLYKTQRGLHTSELKIQIEDNFQVILIGKKGDTGYFLSAPITVWSCSEITKLVG